MKNRFDNFTNRDLYIIDEYRTVVELIRLFFLLGMPPNNNSVYLYDFLLELRDIRCENEN